MKTTLLLLFPGVANAAAQYTIDWHTMDAGGGSGAEGAYEMRGTLGQPDVSPGGTGSAVFVGGYWSLLDESVPLLRIFRVGPDVVLAWPNPSPGFALQASPDLVPPSWTAGRHFFRLRRP